MLSFFNIRKNKSIRKMALSLNHLFKGASFPFPLFLKAGMALEACLVMPLFLFFMMTLLYSLEMIRFQSDVREALHQAGSQACFLAYEQRYIQEQEGYPKETAPGEVGSYLKKQTLPFLCIEGGHSGLKVTAEEDCHGKGNLKIEADYSMKPFIRWLPVGKINIRDEFFGHEFIGYTGPGDGEDRGNGEIYVYITPTGTKYHLSPKCTYLKVSAKAASCRDIEQLRNESGGKYYPCENCKPAGNGLVYYTEWGNRYHGKSNCPALKRTVYIIPLSQVGNRTVCKKCG